MNKPDLSIDLIEAFKYCPYCGAEYRQQQSENKKCSNCGKDYFINLVPAVAGLCINHKNELLYIKRKREPHKDTWDFPAGFVDLSDESLEDSLARELEEEVGVELDKIGFFASYKSPYIYDGILKYNLTVFFVCYIGNQEITINKDEIADYKFSLPQDFNPESFGFPFLKELHRNILSNYSEIIKD